MIWYFILFWKVYIIGENKIKEKFLKFQNREIIGPLGVKYGVNIACQPPFLLENPVQASVGGAEGVRLNKFKALEQEAASCKNLDQFLRKEVPSTSKANVS